MSEARISVVCPTFNCAEVMMPTLRSLASQSQAPEEIIFSDDGSTDGTPEALRRWAKEQKKISIKILENTHAGPGGARNAGIRAASCPWIAFMDSDDLWHPNKLARVRQETESYPDCDFFLHWEDFRRCDGGVSLLEHGKNVDLSRSIGSQLYNSNFCSTSAVVVRKALIDQVGGFDVNLPTGQDYELWLRLSPYMKLRVIPEVLGSYVERTGSITSRPYHRRYPFLLKILWRHRNKGHWYQVYGRLFRATVSRAWLGAY